MYIREKQNYDTFSNLPQIAYCSVFGVTSGAYVGLTSVVLVDLLGLERLTNAFGLLLLFQGIASVIGPPIIGEFSFTNKKLKMAKNVNGIKIVIFS